MESHPLEIRFLFIVLGDILTFMTPLAVVMVLLSAILHASWNFLLKRARNGEVFTWWLNIAICVVFLPMGIVLAWREPVDAIGWGFILGTVFLHWLYFLLLARGYIRADLSVVYPIARGAGPALVPILGVLVLRETVAPLAVAGIVAVVVGIYTVYWWGRLGQILRDPLKFLKESGTRYALLTGLVIATYSVWDKVGVSHVTPFLYLYLMTLGTTLFLTPYMLRFHGGRAIVDEWNTSLRSIVGAGLLSFVAYGLVLSALRISRVSYVAPAREVGIVFAVLLGTLILKEPFGKGRLLGSSLIVAGLVLIALAP